jgi:hypothetical protein
VLPSIALANEHFQDFLIEVLNGTTEDGLAKIAWRLSKWLPSSPSVSDEAVASDSEYLALYRRRSRSTDIPSLVASLIARRKGWADVLAFLAGRVSPAVVHHASELLPFLLDHFAVSLPNDGANNDAFTLFMGLAQASPTVVGAAVDDRLDLFEKVILRHSERRFGQIAQLLPNKGRLLPVCVKYIHENPDRNMMQLLDVLAPSIAGGEDVRLVLEKCIPPLFISHGKPLHSIAQVVRSIFAAKRELAAEHSGIAERLVGVALSTADSDAQNALLGSVKCCATCLWKHRSLLSNVWRQLLLCRRTRLAIVRPTTSAQRSGMPVCVTLAPLVI